MVFKLKQFQLHELLRGGLKNSAEWKCVDFDSRLVAILTSLLEAAFRLTAGDT